MPSVLQATFLAAALIAGPALLTWKIWITAGRRRHIRAKYPKGDVAQKVLQRQLWIGQTAEQLVDAFGRPSSIDQKVSKTKSKETWRYDRRKGKRFGLRITIEDGAVTGWDEKARGE